LFDSRIRWILAALAGLYAVFLARVLYLQTAGAEEARESVAARLSDSVPLPPRRGTILDAAGRRLAWDEVGFDLHADAFGLGAVEWECPGCGSVVRTHEVDPGEGPEDLPPGPAPPPGPCGCGRGGDGWAPTYAADRLGLAELLGGTREGFAAELDAVRLAGWRAARAAAADRRGSRWWRNALRDHLSRPRRVKRGIGREAAMEVFLNPERYPGLRVETRVRRTVEPSLDGATAVLVGRAGPVLGDDLAARGDEFEEEGLTPGLLRHISVGRSGVERAFDGLLRGTFGRERRTRDLHGREASRETETPVRDGADLRLTIDLELQAAAERALGGRKGGLVAIDPATGEILALAGSGGLADGEPLPAVTGLDAGSVLKVWTAIVAEEGGLSPERGEVRCVGRESRPVSCEHVHGEPGLVEALAGSCNAYFGTAAIRVGTRPLQDYARRLRIAEPYAVGIDYQGGGTDWVQERFERPWVRTDLANLGIGQGPVMVSPLQVAALYAAVANGGRPVEPHLVRGTGRPPGEPLLLPSTLARIRAGLEEVVRSGTASSAGLGALRAAGKTGTAQVSGRRGLWNAWFAGYAPAAEPRVVVVAVLCDSPESGGRAAAPVVAAFLAEWEAWRARGPAGPGAGEGR
jgi:penicillin-binding protein 2